MGQQAGRSSGHQDTAPPHDDALGSGSNSVTVTEDQLACSTSASNQRTSRVDRLFRRAQESLGVRTRGGRDRSHSPAASAMTIKSGKRHKEDSDSAPSSLGMASSENMEKARAAYVDVEAVDLSFETVEVADVLTSSAEVLSLTSSVNEDSNANASFEMKHYELPAALFDVDTCNNVSSTAMHVDSHGQTELVMNVTECSIKQTVGTVDGFEKLLNCHLGSIEQYEDAVTCEAVKHTHVDEHLNAKMTTGQPSTGRMTAFHLAQEIRPPELVTCLGVACPSDLGLSPIDEMAEAVNSASTALSDVSAGEEKTLPLSLEGDKCNPTGCFSSAVVPEPVLSHQCVGSQSSFHMLASDTESQPACIQPSLTGSGSVAGGLTSERDIASEAKTVINIRSLMSRSVDSDLVEDVFAEENVSEAMVSSCYAPAAEIKDDDLADADAAVDNGDQNKLKKVNDMYNVSTAWSKPASKSDVFSQGKSLSLDQLNNSATSDRITRATGSAQHRVVEVTPYVATSRLLSSGADSTLTRKKHQIQMQMSSPSPNTDSCIGVTGRHAESIDSPMSVPDAEDGAVERLPLGFSHDSINAFKTMWTEWEHVLASLEGPLYPQEPKTDVMQASQPSEQFRRTDYHVRYSSESSMPSNETPILANDQVHDSSSDGRSRQFPSRSISQISLDEVITSHKTVPDRLDFWKLENFEGILASAENL
jgi:hypothetical protein